jgi:hypothetical protein
LGLNRSQRTELMPDKYFRQHFHQQKGHDKDTHKQGTDSLELHPSPNPLLCSLRSFATYLRSAFKYGFSAAKRNSISAISSSRSFSSEKIGFSGMLRLGPYCREIRFLNTPRFFHR